jgi:hypothetical protein
VPFASQYLPLPFHIFPTESPPLGHLSDLLGQQILPDSEHLGAHVGSKAVHLLAVLLNLLGVQHTFQAAGFLGHLEQSLPLILRQGGLLGQHSLGILSLSLRLPLRDFSLLTGDLALIELEVVEIGVVGFDALEEEVASLLKERVDGEVEAVN